MNLIDICVQKQHTLCIDDYCMNELNRVLTYKFFNIEKNMEIINRIMSLSTVKFLFTNQSKWNLYKTKDSKDDRVVASAITNKIDYLLTGDKDLLKFRTNKTIIVSPTNLIGMI